MASDLRFCHAATVDVLAPGTNLGYSHVSTHEPLLPAPEAIWCLAPPSPNHSPFDLLDTGLNRRENGMSVHDGDPQVHNPLSPLNVDLLLALLLIPPPNPATADAASDIVIAAPAPARTCSDLDPVTTNLPHHDASHHHGSESSNQAASDGEHHQTILPNQNHFSDSKLYFLLRVKTLVIVSGGHQSILASQADVGGFQFYGRSLMYSC